jgi:ankyrin repeat protein
MPTVVDRGKCPTIESPLRLVNAGADVNFRATWVGSTVYSFVPSRGRQSMAALLLQHRASLNDKNKYGETALSLARVYFRDRKLAQMLQQAATKQETKHQ